MSESDRAARRRETEARPWELPGNVRRDALPHRALVLIVLGGVALAFGFLAVFLAVPALVALPVGLVVRRLADHDLREMRRGRMDPAGRRLTVLALLWGTVGALLCLLCWVPFAIRFFVLN